MNNLVADQTMNALTQINAYPLLAYLPATPNTVVLTHNAFQNNIEQSVHVHLAMKEIRVLNVHQVISY